MTIPASYANMPPELVKIMIEMSGNPEEKEQILTQLAMAKALGGKATELNDRAPSNKIGGLAHVAAKGLLGYQGAKDKEASDARLEAYKNKNVDGRRAYWCAMYPGSPGCEQFSNKPSQMSGPGAEGGGLSEGGGLTEDFGDHQSVSPMDLEMFSRYGGTGGF